MVDPNGHTAMQVMVTDYSDAYYGESTSSSTCVDGVCTVTTSEDQGGYMASISTTFTILPMPSQLGEIGAAGVSCVHGPCGAVAMGGTAMGIATYIGASIGAAIESGTVAAGAASASLLGGAIFGTAQLSIGAGFALGYLIKNKYESTPQGAWEAFGAGITFEVHPDAPDATPSWWPLLPTPPSTLTYLGFP